MRLELTQHVFQALDDRDFNLQQRCVNMQNFAEVLSCVINDNIIPEKTVKSMDRMNLKVCFNRGAVWMIWGRYQTTINSSCDTFQLILWNLNVRKLRKDLATSEFDNCWRRWRVEHGTYKFQNEPQHVFLNYFFSLMQHLSLFRINVKTKFFAVHIARIHMSIQKS
jgi:hypothetical protein